MIREGGRYVATLQYTDIIKYTLSIFAPCMPVFKEQQYLEVEDMFKKKTVEDLCKYMHSDSFLLLFGLLAISPSSVPAFLSFFVFLLLLCCSSRFSGYLLFHSVLLMRCHQSCLKTNPTTFNIRKRKRKQQWFRVRTVPSSSLRCSPLRRCTPRWKDWP